MANAGNCVDCGIPMPSDGRCSACQALRNAMVMTDDDDDA